ncbi:MAG: FAD-dependent oxidoreductase, partial [SAR324 cluster bacterium]|nr:FAD-dependent oxidoreductase [SAR324 cluster bacterium]
MSPKSGNPEFTVIGSGIIGISSALALQKEGFRVTVVDREKPGQSCSFGNAGAISPSSVLPNSLPGVMFKVPGWLFREDGPLFIQWKYFPKLIPWLIRFLNSANWDKV